MRFSPERVDIRGAVTPPYDVGDEDEWRRLLKRPVTAAKLLAPTGGDRKYSQARDWLERWLSDGTLTVDPKPSLYLYRQRFHHKGRERERWGVICLVELREYGDGIFPHEHTHEEPIEDRLKLLRACKAHFGPVFMLYRDPEGALLPKPEGRPLYDFEAPGRTKNTVWRIASPEAIEAFCQGLKKKELLIADGHHRYEASLRLRREGGPNYVLAYLVRAEDSGLLILPLHRIIKGNSPRLAQILKALERAGFNLERSMFEDVPRGCLGLKAGTASFLLRIPSTERLKRYLDGEPEPLKPLEITVLHKAVLEGLLGDPEVEYEPDEKRAQTAASRGRPVFFLPPVSVDDIERVAKAGLRMHPKTTYFHPKPLSGLIMWKFE